MNVSVSNQKSILVYQPQKENKEKRIYFWTKNTKIFPREEEKTPVIWINFFDDLRKIMRG